MKHCKGCIDEMYNKILRLFSLKMGEGFMWLVWTSPFLTNKRNWIKKCVKRIIISIIHTLQRGDHGPRWPRGSWILFYSTIFIRKTPTSYANDKFCLNYLLPNTSVIREKRKEKMTLLENVEKDQIEMNSQGISVKVFFIL